MSKDPPDSSLIPERGIRAGAEQSLIWMHELGEVSPLLGDAVSQQPGLLPGEAPGAFPPHPQAVSSMLSRAPGTPGTPTTLFSLFFPTILLYIF